MVPQNASQHSQRWHRSAHCHIRVPYYGYPLQFVSANDLSQHNGAASWGVLNGTDEIQFLTFENDLTFSVSGTGSMTLSFNAPSTVGFTVEQKPHWQLLLDFAKANECLPVQFTLVAGIILNNDGVTRFADWSNTPLGLDNTKIAVGPDFASILKGFPSS